MGNAESLAVAHVGAQQLDTNGLKKTPQVDPKTSVSFTLNGEAVVVENASPYLSLNDWLRSQPGLSGTKKMCGEGGCGCCAVSVKRLDPGALEESVISMNSCLCPLYSVEGWTITTVEGIGSSRSGFHPIQTRIAERNGSQCGYCTPGFVMSMYSLLDQNSKPTKQEIEDNFDGNICRCTGYRPILEAMKTFAVDSDIAWIDIEDLSTTCPRTGKPCHGLCKAHVRGPTDPVWYRPSTLTDVLTIIQNNPGSKVKLLVGDTGKGVFKTMSPSDYFDIFIDLKGISDLYQTQLTGSSLIVGAAVTLASLIQLLQENQQVSTNFQYIAEHFLKVANVPVRNVGSWAGNLMLTHDHNDFPSDVFTVLEAAGATLTIANASGSQTYTLQDFLKVDMTQSVIVSMELPFAGAGIIFRSFKVMPRNQNAHAYVNAAFSMQVDPNSTVQGTPVLVFGGIQAHAVLAVNTANVLQQQSLLDPNTLKNALAALEQDIVPDTPPVAASVEYRKSLALSLFYKYYLACIVDHVSPRVVTAANPYVRPISSGTQSYSTVPSNYPITQPIPKLASKLQASGEAQYTTDIPPYPDELAAAFVLTTQGNATITGINLDLAAKMPGFMKVLTAADIPQGGQNNFLTGVGMHPEPVFATSFSEYAGHAVALVLADTQEYANAIAQSITVNYQNVKKPILTIQDAIAAQSFFPSPGPPIVMGNAKEAIAASARVITGSISCGAQYHFHMETQTSLCIPEEDGYSVHSSTQWTDLTQSAVATVLGIPVSSVDVTVKRVGGAYGGKITRSQQIAAACALGAYATKRPVRMHMDIDTNMLMIGKREPYYATFTIGCTDSGVINGIEMTIYNDAGCYGNDSTVQAALTAVDNAYFVQNWLVTPVTCKTNTASNTACRSPGTLPGIFIMESLVDYVAKSLNLDVEQVKLANLYQQGQVTPYNIPLNYCSIRDIWNQLYKSADVDARKQFISEFNQVNRWRKRGISVVPLKFGLGWSGAPYTVLVSIYATDGTVAVTHGGVEVGQGINTKVAQVAAKTLGISIDMIKIKPSNSLTNPNGMTTGGSISSELACLGVLNACTELKHRIAPVQQVMGNPTWVQLIQKCYSVGIDLSSKQFTYQTTDFAFAYFSYGATCAEVELDVLTGETQVIRVDILYDCGESINPDIDVGQVEGAFVMGMGYWMTEKFTYDPDSGQLLTHNTWEYKPPSSQDIPIDWRVELLKNAPNPIGILRSKASGEPPQCMSCSVLFGAKRAVESARAEVQGQQVFSLSGPATTDVIQQYCMVDPSQFFF
ncbi:hypothetical protein EMCRGX_G005217 [Ephydatia muelleri]